MEKKKIIKNKKRFILFLFIIILLLLIISYLLGMKTGDWLYGVVQNYNSSQEEVLNTIDVGDENKEADNVLMVELEGKSNNNTEEEKPQDKNENTVKNQEVKPKIVNAPYYIKVNCEANVVTVYKKDSAGKYTVPIKAMVCSIGTATPASGVYDISDKYTWRLLEGNVYGQYACRIVGSILFHSVPYMDKNKSTLEWWEYDKLGTKASLGCIRLTVLDAKWIYDNCIPGTKVEFYSSSTSGPLGKPTAQKISSDEAVRHWDPTDPDANNPWPGYLSNKNKVEPEVPNEPAMNENNSEDGNIKNENVENENIENNNKQNDNVIDNNIVDAIDNVTNS